MLKRSFAQSVATVFRPTGPPWWPPPPVQALGGPPWTFECPSNNPAKLPWCGGIGGWRGAWRGWPDSAPNPHALTAAGAGGAEPLLLPPPPLLPSAFLCCSLLLLWDHTPPRPRPNTLNAATQPEGNPTVPTATRAICFYDPNIFENKHDV